MVYEALALAAHGRFQKPYFVTLAREQDVDQHIQRVTLQANEVRDVSSLASALVCAHTARQPTLRDCVLVDCGASDTLLVVVRDGQQVFSSSFAQGSRAIVDALTRTDKLTPAEAEARLSEQNLFTGPQRVPALGAAVDNWLNELRKTIDDWRRQSPDLAPAAATLPVILSGGLGRSIGLLDYLRNQRSLAFSLWPKLAEVDDPLFFTDFAGAYGAAVAAFQRPLESASLLPPPLRVRRRQLNQLAKVNVAGVLCLLLAALVLLLATWHKSSLIVRKRGLVQKAEAATQQVRQLESFARQRDQAFERYWPLLDQQERTLDLLHTLRVLQQCRARHDFWCVLLADGESYAHASTLPAVVTNRFGLTNTAALAEENLLRPAFVIELCVPAQGDQTLKVLSDVVADLRKDALFGRVDSVPAAQRRALVDLKVLIPDRHFAVSVALADLGWRALFDAIKLPEPFVGGTNAVRRLPGGLFPRSRSVPLNLPSPAVPTPAKPAA
jgi:hypothetical protein